MRERGDWASPEERDRDEGPAKRGEPVYDRRDEPLHKIDPGHHEKDLAAPRRPIPSLRDLDDAPTELGARTHVPEIFDPIVGQIRLSELFPEPEDPDLAQREASEFVTSTIEAFADFLIQRMAEAHGMILIYDAVKLLYGAYKWERVGEDGGGVDFQAPLPLSNNTVLGVTFHLGGDPDTPPITFGLAPSDASGAGAVAIGKLEMDPAPSHVDATSSRSRLPEKRFGPVQIVPLRLPSGLRDGLEPTDAAAAARNAAEEGLLPRLLPERQRLLDAGVELVLGCDSELGLALWAHVGDANQSEPTVTRTAEGQVRVELVPQAVDFVIGPGLEMGLTASLHRSDSQEPTDEVLITWSGIEQHHEAKIERPHDAEMVPPEAVRTEGAGAPGPGAASAASVAADRDGSMASVGPARPTAGAQPTAAAQSIRLTHLEHVPVTSVWSAEADHFTPWLLRHGSELSKALRIDIDLQPWEDNAQLSHGDVVGREAATGSLVIIEKQYGPSDDLHLGRMLTYTAASKPTTIIWIAEEFREEHRAALDWLNEHTDPAIRFFGVFLYAVTLAEAPGLIAPMLQLAIGPSK
jgi:hypothetical protein